MAKSEFEQFLSESFCEGVYYRELRLSEKEVKKLRNHYPKALVKRTSEGEDAFSKTWYEVNLIPFERKSEPLDSIRRENLRLKRELASLKKMKK